VEPESAVKREGVMHEQGRGTDSGDRSGRARAAGFSRAGFRQRLCRRLTACVAAMAALEKISSPIVPYIAAWREHEKIIWYEYVGARFLALLGCERGEVDEVFRQSIVDRRLYRYAERESKVEEEIVTRAELRGDQAGLREEVKKAGRWSSSINWPCRRGRRSG
jgi:hypothetical protein